MEITNLPFRWNFHLQILKQHNMIILGLYFEKLFSHVTCFA